MKIYNKKGFAWGIFWLVLGVSALVADLWINPDDFLPKTIKDVIIDFIILIMGLVGFLRAFSAKATREDIIEENDERNKLVKIKTKARVNDVMFWTMIVFLVVGVVGYYWTDNIAWAFLAFAPILQMIVYVWSSIFISIYYEHRE